MVRLAGNHWSRTQGRPSALSKIPHILDFATFGQHLTPALRVIPAFLPIRPRDGTRRHIGQLNQIVTMRFRKLDALNFICFHLLSQIALQFALKLTIATSINFYPRSTQYTVVTME